MISVVSSEEHGENEIICMPVPRNGQYEAIQFLKERKRLVELRASYTAIANEP